MIERFCRKSFKLILLISTSSINILPVCNSTRRNKAVPNDDLPEKRGNLVILTKFYIFFLQLALEVTDLVQPTE